MADIPQNVNPQMVDAIQKAQQFTMGAAIKSSGAGKAYQSVAQSTAIAIQDAADYLRNMGTITATTTGVAFAEWLATGDKDSAAIIAAASGAMDGATKTFGNIGQAAATVLQQYPSE